MADADAIARELKKIDWSSLLWYGNIKVKIMAGKAEVVYVEETVRLE